MVEFVPNAAQARTLQLLADDGSEGFGERLANFQHLHDAAIEIGEPICPCLTCDPAGERRLTC
jgi:hypothetical protein